MTRCVLILRKAGALRSVETLGRGALLEACALPIDGAVHVDVRLRRAARVALVRDIALLDNQLRFVRCEDAGEDLTQFCFAPTTCCAVFCG